MKTTQTNPMPGTPIALEDVDAYIGRILWGDAAALVVRGTHPDDFLKDVSIAVAFDARSWAWRVCGSDFAVNGAGSYRFADEAEANEKVEAHIAGLRAKGLAVEVSAV